MSQDIRTSQNTRAFVKHSENEVLCTLYVDMCDRICTLTISCDPQQTNGVGCDTHSHL